MRPFHALFSAPHLAITRMCSFVFISVKKIIFSNRVGGRNIENSSPSYRHPAWMRLRASTRAYRDPVLVTDNSLSVALSEPGAIGGYNARKTNYLLLLSSDKFILLSWSHPQSRFTSTPGLCLSNDYVTLFPGSHCPSNLRTHGGCLCTVADCVFVSAL